MDKEGRDVKDVKNQIEEKKTREDLQKVMRQGRDITISLEGEEIEAYWSKVGWGTRAYYRGYVQKKLRDADKMGILFKDICREELSSEKPEDIFLIKHKSVIPESVEMEADGNVIGKDKYSIDNDASAIVFNEPVSGEFKVKYEYYDDRSYQDIVNTASTAILLYMSIRDRDNHSKKVFESPSDVEDLNQVELSEIMKVYLDEIKVTEEDLKNLQSPSTTEKEDSSQKDTD